MAIGTPVAGTPLDFGSPRTNSTLVAPGGRAVGSRIIAALEVINSTAPTIATPDGWTLLGSRAWGPSQSAYGRMYVFTRVADGTSADNLATIHASMYSQGEWISYPGVHATTPFDIEIQFANGNTTSSDASVSATPATTVTDGAAVVTFRHSWDGTAITPTSGWTERVDHPAGHVQDRIYATPSSTGTISIPSGNSAGTKPWVTATLVLRDAAAVEPGPYEPQWMPAVAAARAGTGQARMMFLGDSLTEGEGVTTRADRWIELLIPAMRSSLGIAGTGLGHTPPRYATFMVGVSEPWRTPATASPTITNRVYSRAPGGYFQWTITGTAYTVLYSGGSGFGPLSVSTDGAAAETIPASSSGVAHRWHKTGLSAGSHTVRVTAGTGGGNVMGVIAYNGDSPTSGLTYLDHAWSGGSSDEWGPGAAHDITSLDFDPHIVLDEQMGANDYLESSSAPATCASRYAARNAIYKGAASKPLPVGVILPYWPTGSGIDETATNGLGFTLDDYRNAHAAQAIADEGRVIDLRDSIGTLTLGDLASDGTHLNLSGQTKIANAILAGVLELSLPPSGGSEITATATISGGGRKIGRGGASVTASATTPGGGRKRTQAGSSITATATTAGAGRKVGRAGSTVGATATTTAVGTKIARGGSTVTATATVEGGGRRVEAGSGGSVITATATTTGGGRKVTSGGSTLTATTTTIALGRKWISGGSTVTATATVTGGGRRGDDPEPGRGGSVIVATASTTGGGYKRARGGSVVTALATVTGGGRNPDTPPTEPGSIRVLSVTRRAREVSIERRARTVTITLEAQ